MTKENMEAAMPGIALLASRVDGYGTTASLDDILESLSELQAHPLFCPDFLQANKEALLSNDWSGVENLINKGFLSDSRLSLVVSPYRVWRPGVKTRLSLLVCEKIAQAAAFPFDRAHMDARYGAVDYTPVIPVNVVASAGNIGGDTGESFVVPTAWTRMPGVSGVSPYIDMRGAQKRVAGTATDDYLRALCDPALAQALIAFRNDETACMAARYQEYSLHEYGHAVGRFVQRIGKIRGGMAQAAFEEWRCDGVMAQLVSDHVRLGRIDRDAGQKILMSNFLTRFGMDIARNDGKKDHDFLASHYILSCFLATKMMSIKDGKLHCEGDVSRFETWQALYGFMADAAENVSVHDEEDMIAKYIPRNALSADDFAQMVQQALKMSEMCRRADRANDNARPQAPERKNLP